MNKRFFTALAVVLFVLTQPQAPLAEAGAVVGTYTLSCTAKRAGADILIKTIILHKLSGGTTEVLSRPYMTIGDGKAAEILVKSDSEIRMEVIKPMKENHVLVIVSVLKDGAVVWAQASTADIVAETAATQPAGE